MYKIYNTHSWSYEQISPYSKDLTKAMLKLEAKFPEDINIKEIALAIAKGTQHLWLILDEQEKFCAFLTTELSRNLKNEKRLTLCQLGGNGGASLADVLPTIERYAKEHNVKEILPIGRIGWHKQLKSHGYKPLILKYRKELDNV